jgi:alpha-tubulin suppressor-like RCC1 family protein
MGQCRAGSLGPPRLPASQGWEEGRWKEVIKIMRRPFIISLENYFNLKTAACGYGFTLFATEDRQVFCTGLNDSGQIRFHRRVNKERRINKMCIDTTSSSYKANPN